jgi:hypothetical protein
MSLLLMPWLTLLAVASPRLARVMTVFSPFVFLKVFDSDGKSTCGRTGYIVHVTTVYSYHFYCYVVRRQ